MTTGANSNVRHEGLTYHVQTEDMGAGNAEIVSLVYHEGQILKTVRKDYDDIAGSGAEEIRQRVMTQHRTVIQAILRGRLSPPGAVPQTPPDKPSLIVSPLSDPRAGEQTSLLVLLRNERTFDPIAGADVRVLFAGVSAQPVVIHEAATDAKGFTLAEVDLPDAAAVDLSLIVEVASGTGRARAELPVLPGSRSWREAPASPPAPAERADLIVSDLGDPRAGEQASFMVLLRDERTCRPIEGATIRLLFADGSREATQVCQGVTDTKGYHLAEALLPGAESTEASVIIEATKDAWKTEVVIPVLVPRS
jgi:hypothetical protein